MAQIEIPLRTAGEKFPVRAQVCDDLEAGRNLNVFENVIVWIYSQSKKILGKFSMADEADHDSENFKIIDQENGIFDVIITPEISSKIMDENYIIEIKIKESSNDQWIDVGKEIVFVGRTAETRNV